MLSWTRRKWSKRMPDMRLAAAASTLLTIALLILLLLLLFLDVSYAFTVFSGSSVTTRGSRSFLSVLSAPHHHHPRNTTETKPFTTPTTPPQIEGLNNETKAAFSTTQKKMSIQEIKNSVDIVSLIESYNLDKFQRKGANGAVALCPFHDDRNPSLSIDGSRQIYKCFACGEGGDIFRFVQEYNRVNGREIGFGEAVKEISTGIKFVNGSHSSTVRHFMRTSNKTSSSRSSKGPLSNQEKEECERIYLANAAAATFFADFLLHTSAGGARAHLLGRGLKPHVATTFGIGYAPDAYFGKQNRGWGKGSLVEHLQGLGFNATEIVSAGLATEVQKRDSEKMTDETPRERSISFESIMDRFRNRLMIPILDSSGKRILGFGGRALDETEKPGVYNPKYLNSPESLVFSKKEVLFAMSVAESVIRRSIEPVDLFMVEGYMDAIALWSKGIGTSVATMGTAISEEQLSSAVQLVSSRGGKLAIFLDSDNAGVAAANRICSNGMLFRAQKNYPAVVKIVSAPGPSKDPADYLEHLEATGLTEIEIRGNISSLVQQAPDWQEWYIDRVVASFDSQEEGVDSERAGFETMFQCLGNFLAGNCEEHRWEKEASRIKGKLASILGRNHTWEKDEISTIQDQLESDLIDLTSRLSAIQKNSVLGESGSLITAKQLTSSFSRGYGPSGPEDFAMVPFDIGTANSTRAMKVRKRPRVKMARDGRKDKLTRQLTPHFNGFKFKYESDKEWLGFGQTKKRGSDKSFLGSFKDQQNSRYQKVSPVYFNSNVYHGKQFLTGEAMLAGYSNKALNVDPSLMLKGVASLIKQDADSMHSAAEDEILRLAVRSPSARLTLKRAIEARLAVSDENPILWSAIEKEWLFSELVQNLGSIPSACNTTSELRDLLAKKTNAPKGAFFARPYDEVLTTVPPEEGSLDRYFKDVGPVVTLSQELESFRAQELLSVLQMTGVSRDTEIILEKLDSIIDGGNTDSTNTSLTSNSHLTDLLGRLQSNARKSALYRASSNRVTKKLVDQIGRDKSEGRMSVSFQKELCSMVEEYVANFQELEPAEYFPHDPNEEMYEDTIERLREEWGDWMDDDFDWRNDRSRRNSNAAWLQNHLSDEDLAEEETLEEGLARIHREWAGWIDKNNITAP